MQSNCHPTGPVITRFSNGKGTFSNEPLASHTSRAPAHRAGMDGEEHRHIRKQVAIALRKLPIEPWRPRLRTAARSLLRNLERRDRFDVISEYAAPLSVTALAVILGIDALHLEHLQAWSNARAQIYNPVRTARQTLALAEALEGLNEFFRCLVESRWHSNGADLIGSLLSAEDSGEQLTSSETVLACNLLLIEGELAAAALVRNALLPSAGCPCCWIGDWLMKSGFEIAIWMLFDRFPQLQLDSAYSRKHKRLPASRGIGALWVCPR